MINTSGSPEKEPRQIMDIPDGDITAQPDHDRLTEVNRRDLDSELRGLEAEIAEASEMDRAGQELDPAVTDALKAAHLEAKSENIKR